ncbi:MAG: putative DNA binding domain-containing protein [Armatimonadetes bacterium]|nr:putative DNA binding domain-containing protein [Armatimonadota bacterium]
MKYTEEELIQKLKTFLALPNETEWVEFKEAKLNYDFEKIGKYFSALSNEANLKGKDYGWLIFGVNKVHHIVGSEYRRNRADLDHLKHEISEHTSNHISFTEIHELIFDEGRVIMFQIPPALPGSPTAWKGHYFGREGESLVPLNLQKLDNIRSPNIPDWSAQIIPEADLIDLDSAAIAKARLEYKVKHPSKAEEVDRWDNITYLNKAKVTIQGKITNSAILLLGKEESEHFLSPAVAKMTWILKNNKGIEQDYEHFGPPFLLNVTKLFAKVRNLRYRYMPDGTLFPIEITRYDSWVIREALHNCIVHQDYSKRGRISVVETPDNLIFTNVGSFIPGSVEAVIEMDSPPEIYRNPFLANAMVNLNMIDTIGGGIKKMFVLQKQRLFPMPDYDLAEPTRVVVKIFGEILDENYTKILIEKTDLDLSSVILLDKVQKKIKISKDEHSHLKKLELVEGRYPNIYITSTVASLTNLRAQYIKNLGFDNDHYKKMIVTFVEKYKSASRKDIDDLLMDKLSDVLDDNQKKNKIRNIISAMKREGKIINRGSRKKPKWVLLIKRHTLDEV